MKRSVLFLTTVLALSAVQASASVIEDTDGNGSYSMDEMKAAYPELTEEVFTSVDTDQSGEISEDELAAAVEAGVITAD